MKHLITNSILFALLLNVQNIFANSNNVKSNEDSLVYLEIRGKIILKEKTKNLIYKVELIENNRVIDSVLEKDRELFSFGLLKNKYYALKIYKTGFLPKLIMINTYIPDNRYLTDYFIFDFETDLLSVTEEEKLDQDTKDFPLAIVQFDSSRKGFYYNREYSRNIKLQLYRNIISDNR